MTIREGQIVLVKFPFSDLRQTKLRPVLVLRRLPGKYSDWLICPISSSLSQEIPGFDETVRKGDGDFPASGLKKSSVIRISRLASIHESELLGSIGQLDRTRLREIQRRLAKWLETSRTMD